MGQCCLSAAPVDVKTDRGTEDDDDDDSLLDHNDSHCHTPIQKRQLSGGVYAETTESKESSKSIMKNSPSPPLISVLASNDKKETEWNTLSINDTYRFAQAYLMMNMSINPMKENNNTNVGMFSDIIFWICHYLNGNATQSVSSNGQMLYFVTDENIFQCNLFDLTKSNVSLTNDIKSIMTDTVHDRKEEKKDNKNGKNIEKEKITNGMVTNDNTVSSGRHKLCVNMVSKSHKSSSNGQYKSKNDEKMKGELNLLHLSCDYNRTETMFLLQKEKSQDEEIYSYIVSGVDMNTLRHWKDRISRCSQHHNSNFHLQPNSRQPYVNGMNGTKLEHSKDKTNLNLKRANSPKRKNKKYKYD